MSKYKFKNCLTYKLTALLVVSLSLACSSVFANGEYYFDEIPTNRLLNPIYLDKSRTENSVTNTNTSIPYNLRGNFDEADYFHHQLLKIFLKSHLQ